MREIIGKRGERVRHRVPDVLLAVAILVDRILIEVLGHELREAHGPGPGAFHILGRDRAVLHHPDRVDKILLEQLLTVARIGQGGQHLQRVMRGVVRGAERGFPAPNREHDEGIDTIGLLDGRKGGLMRLVKLAALPRQFAHVLRVQILLGRAHELRLAWLLAGAFRDIEVRQREIGGKALGHGIVDIGTDAVFNRFRPERAKERSKPFLRNGGGGGWPTQQKRKQCAKKRKLERSFHRQASVFVVAHRLVNLGCKRGMLKPLRPAQRVLPLTLALSPWERELGRSR